MSKASQGIFCISLDFEKFWGVHDICSAESVELKMMTLRNIVETTLTLFQKYNIHATWATVGLLFDEDPLTTYNFKKKISYKVNSYSPYPFKDWNGIDTAIFSGSEEISWIIAAEHQELASHSFSHLYGLEEGISNSSFIEDIDDMEYASKMLKEKLVSIVFPRNQVSKAWLIELNRANYIAFRGNQESSLWSNTKYASESIFKRFKRWGDAYWGKSKTLFRSLSGLQRDHGLLNIPANRFLRPVGKNKWLETKKINKIKQEMSHCAEQSKIYHLWWHPHNFSEKQEIAFTQLENILKHFKTLQESEDFQSLNMAEIARND